MSKRFATRQHLLISLNVKLGGVRPKKFELYFKGSAANAPLSLHDLRCSALQVFVQVAGMSAI
ncbi:hypothetical protein B6D29_01175 [Microgenomates bacterium UTCPR1]|nr:MAG: hypothetical protein B6D29_01175 [Microgenomates bacterium UTCPR1]